MKIGFMGAGNMAQAIIGGILKNKIASADDIMASDVSEVTKEKVEKELGITVLLDNVKVAENADVLFLAVKPIYAEGVISQIKDSLKLDVVIVSIMAGKSLEWLTGAFNKDVGHQYKIIRTMPNTPALVGEGMAALCPGEYVDKDSLDTVLNIFGSFGKAQVVNENLMDSVVAVSGSSPAYVFMFIEAMADEAVALGMPRKSAYEFAAQSVLGSAKMVLETGKHPGELKDMVCSPAGTTIDAVESLEKTGFRSSVMEAMKACAEKSRNM